MQSWHVDGFMCFEHFRPPAALFQFDLNDPSVFV